jgi:hypothetical protein
MSEIKYSEIRSEEVCMSKQSVWLSYDLGVRGDYEGLYRWLDKNKAKECGDSVAYFMFTYQNDLLKELKTDITKSVLFENNSRIYVVRYDKDEKKNKGTFIIGGRKAAPWTGYAGGDEVTDSD